MTDTDSSSGHPLTETRRDSLWKRIRSRFEKASGIWVPQKIRQRRKVVRRCRSERGRNPGGTP